ncbi:MAG: FlgD immunoglobulin-like domain containing protein [Candidatus Eisenbacteria bacterium]
MRKIVLLVLALLLAAAPAYATNWSLTLNSPNKTAAPGATTTFDGTITNSTGVALPIDANLGFVLSPETDLFTIDFAPAFLALNLVLPPAGYTGPIFTISWSTGVLPGTLGQGDIQLSTGDPADPLVLNASYSLRVPGVGSFCKEATPFTAARVSIAADDSLGVPVIAYNVAGEGSIRYAKVVNHSWVPELVTTGVGASAAPSLAFDGGRKPHIAYYKTPTADLAFSEKTGAAWSTTTIDATGDVGGSPSLAIDAALGMHISYYDATNLDLKYAYRPYAGAWATAIVDAGGSVGKHSSVAVDELGNPYIAYYDETNGDLKLARKVSGSWVTEVVDAAGTTGTNTSIEVQGSVISIAYRDETTGAHALRLATGTPGSWTKELVDNAGDPGLSNSLELDAFGQPRIAYLNASGNVARYAAKTNGVGWEFGNIDTPAITFLSMAMRETGDPLVVFGLSGSAVRYASFSTCTTVDVAEGSIARPLLTLEENHPNPFAPRTTIAFTLGRRASVEVRVFDVSGRVVAKPFDSEVDAGRHQIIWDGTNAEGVRLPSGVYLYEVRTEGADRRGRMVMLR